MPRNKRVRQSSGNDISKLFNEQETRVASKIDQSIEELAASINKEFIGISDRFELTRERVNELEKRIHKAFTNVNEELRAHSETLDDHSRKFTKIQDKLTDVSDRVENVEWIVKSSRENGNSSEVGKRIGKHERKVVEGRIDGMVESREYLQEGLSEIRSILMDLLDGNRDNQKQDGLELIQTRVTELENILLSQIGG